ncbi:MAG: serine/threonine protein kinase [Demequinaceae bacterium]|nr:serine/threonine protein kinase [Demequinaceae bacterium]
MGMRLRRPGMRIGSYVVTEILGRGGSGDVYKVIGPGGKPAALKLVDSSANPAARTRLSREVNALRSIDHPGVPGVLDADTDGPEPFVVFDFIDGVSLAHHVKANGPLKGKKLADLAETLASALAAAHASGVIHRDVTPANVMLGSKGPALIDFGLSHRTDDPRLTREGLVSGTAGYVAPEVIDGAEPGMQADLWSWAATIAFAMTGQAPFGLGRGALGKTFAGEVVLPDVPGAEAVAEALSLDVKRRVKPEEVVAALRGKTVRLPAASRAASRPGEPISEHLPVTRIFDLGEEASVKAGVRERLRLPPIMIRRTGTIAAWASALIAVATLVPATAFLVLLFVLALCRVEHRRIASIASMRAKRGAKRGDAAIATIGLPWHFLRSVGEILPSAAIAAAAGGGLATLCWQGVSSGRMGFAADEAHQYWGHALALALGAVLAVGLVWWGPWAYGTRDGVRRVAAIVARTDTAARVWAVVALLAVGVVLFALLWRTEPLFWPLSQLPETVS